MHLRLVPYALMLALLACFVPLAPVAAMQDAETVEAFEPKPVTVVAADGAALAKITIDELADPFLEYDPKSSPQRGFRLVVLSIAVENISSHPVIFNPTHVYLVDEQGFLASRYNIATLPHVAMTIPENESPDRSRSRCSMGSASRRCSIPPEVTAPSHLPSSIWSHRLGHPFK
jgi:hypothetical protein